MICIDMDFFGFILFEIHSASWICKFMSFAKFGKFSDINESLNAFSDLAFFFFPFKAQMTWMLDLFIVVSQDPEALFNFFFFSFFLCYSDWVIAIVLSSTSLLLSSFLLLSLPIEFFISVIVLFSSKIEFILIYSISLLRFSIYLLRLSIFHLFQTCP